MYDHVILGSWQWGGYPPTASSLPSAGCCPLFPSLCMAREWEVEEGLWGSGMAASAVVVAVAVLVVMLLGKWWLDLLLG